MEESGLERSSPSEARLSRVKLQASDVRGSSAWSVDWKWMKGEDPSVRAGRYRAGESAQDARSISMTLSSVSSLILLTVLSKIVFRGLVRPASVESGYVVAMSALNSSHTRFLRVHETPRRVFDLRM